MSRTIGAVMVDIDRCKGCNLCVVACRQIALQLTIGHVNQKGYPFVEQTDNEACNGCGVCGTVCPDACLTVYRVKE